MISEQVSEAIGQFEAGLCSVTELCLKVLDEGWHVQQIDTEVIALNRDNGERDADGWPVLERYQRPRRDKE